MKRLAWIMMIPLLLVHMLSSLLVLTAFYVHQEDIARQYCERRFDAVSSCAGSCVLQKRLDKHKEQEQTQVNQKVQEVYIIGQMSRLLPAPVVAACLSENDYACYRIPHYARTCGNSLLRPPIA